MAEVTSEAFVAQVVDAFATFWAQRTPLAVPGFPFDPDREVDGEAYTRISFQGRDGGEVPRSGTIDRRVFQREGSVVVEVGTRVGQGQRLAYRFIDAAAVWLAQPGLSDYIPINVGTPIEVGVEGAWFVVTVSAEWRYLTDRAWLTT